ncbi:hypothetical protein DENSPDRAFT_833365 [Dentipellis sp. KUC8613]|nr:hypothetical protein DENSPDRAFT_833365 [Dentipellis sp. KUC8613]
MLHDTEASHSSDIQMDTLPSSRTSSESSRGKSPARLPPNRRDYVIGIALLFVVVVLWTSSSFVTQDLYVEGYEKPFLITYLNTSSFSIYLIPFLFRSLWKRYHGNNDDAITGPAAEYQPLVEEHEESHGVEYARNVYVPPEDEDVTLTALPPLTVRQTAKLSSIFCFFWFVANWSLTAALGFTSVASATILSATSGFFTLIIGRLFRVETLTIAKVGAVIMSFAGVLLVSLSDSQSSTEPAGAGVETYSAAHEPRPIWGDFLAILSAAFYALYVTLLKVRIGDESRIDMQLFFGFVGLFNILACWPIGVILHLTGGERIELPTTNRAVAGMLFNMAVTLTSDYIYVIAMLKTTPLVVTIGLSLTMPLAVVGDLWLQHPVKAQVVVGALLVLISFVVVGVEDSQKPREGPVAAVEDSRVRRSREVRWRESVGVTERISADGR